MSYNDPTYTKDVIDANNIWKLAFKFSEIANDNAPLGWSHYIPIARHVIENWKENS